MVARFNARSASVSNTSDVVVMTKHIALRTMIVEKPITQVDARNTGSCRHIQLVITSLASGPMNIAELILHR